ncbi:MAG: anti-phage-associated DUF1156 domain-containing protein [Bacteroidales bacterium]
MDKSFIEIQFPVSKISKESYKERMAGASQTLTGLGKWWGRKPLILVRATIIGLLIQASDNSEKDRDIFLKILTMDDDGMLRRKNKNIPLKELFNHASLQHRTKYFDPVSKNDSPRFRKGITQEEKSILQNEIFLSMGYDDRLKYCFRPEQIDGPSPESWQDINDHLGTKVKSLNELVEQLGKRLFGRSPMVGDAFCGGGSVPFEAARLGCDVYGSDLNPVAALLTWASINIIGGGDEVQEKIKMAQEGVFDSVDRQITEWGTEHNEKGWRADAYLYCVEAKSPATGYWVPLAPSWVISEKYKVCAQLEPDHKTKRYHIRIISGADNDTFSKAQNGTIEGSEMVCPETNERFPVSTIRGDRRVDGKTVYGIRQWEKNDLVPREDDVFQERLYCIRYVETVTKDNGAKEIIRHYIEPDKNDIKREEKVLELLKENFTEWQEKGYIPSKKIPPGDKTEEPKRNRGWTYWYHLFLPRHLLSLGQIINSISKNSNNDLIKNAILLYTGKIIENYARIMSWHPNRDMTSHVFTNQALNTYFSIGSRSFYGVKTIPFIPISYKIETVGTVETKDARSVNVLCDFWVTDPPYADAVNYHELGDFFLAWYEKHLPKLFPHWYTESKAALAVKGNDQSFRESMVDCYSNFTRNMPDNGAQVVMFTHQDSAVWADLALILWASGLQVTAAWTIQTETDTVGIKKGNYVQGTVIMVLRKQKSEEIAFLSDIQADVEYEVKEQLKQMIELDDKENPNFSDTDFQLAAYAAALRVLTSFKRIEDIDVQYELMKKRNPNEKSEVQKIIDSAVAVACEFLVPSGFPQEVWRILSPEERFYVKGLEIQSHGEYRNGVFQELARGYGIRQYNQFLKSGKANETRLMTAIDYGAKDLHNEGFGKTLLRNILFAIRETKKEDSPASGRNWLHNELADYWQVKQRILELLKYIIRTASGIEHWVDDVQAARLLAGYIENDHV